MYQAKYIKNKEMYHKIKNDKAITYIRSCDTTGNEHDISGTIHFQEVDDTVRIYGKITGLSPGKHGFHIHESANLTRGANNCCDGLRGHFNPDHNNHGGPNSQQRHVGDLGNIEADSNGTATIDFTDHMIKLTGKYSIIGRSVVIHADEDDLGLGGNEESLKTGNAGKRIAYGIIGID